jgi:hypothetical protein
MAEANVKTGELVIDHVIWLRDLHQLNRMLKPELRGRVVVFVKEFIHDGFSKKPNPVGNMIGHDGWKTCEEEARDRFVGDFLS